MVSCLQLDVITRSRHSPNRTIIGIGFGNIVAGMIGGLPGAMTIASFPNVYSGGRSQVAGLIAALLLLLVVIVMRPLASEIPLAVIGGIIIINGWNIIDWRFISCIHRVNRGHAFVMLLTALIAIFINFIYAVLFGLVISALISARHVERAEMSRLFSVPLLDQSILGEDADATADPFETRSGLIMFPEQISVASARELTNLVGRDVAEYQNVIFDLSRTSYVDDTAAVMIGQLVNTAMTQHASRFVIAGLSGDVANTLNSLKLLARIPKEYFADDLDAAKEIIKPMLLRD